MQNEEHAGQKRRDKQASKICKTKQEECSRAKNAGNKARVKAQIKVKGALAGKPRNKVKRSEKRQTENQEAKTQTNIQKNTRVSMSGNKREKMTLKIFGKTREFDTK